MLILSVLYALLVLFFILGMLKSKKNYEHKPNNISVIVAARNEENNIFNLLESLEKQTFKNFELIIIDDRSEDNTYKIVQEYAKNTSLNIKLYRINETNNIGKKKAIEFGISKAKYDVLAFTDADCVVKEKWLEQIDIHLDDKTDFICGYSELIYKDKFVTYVKNLERSGFLAMIAGAYGWNLDLSATASNMAYRKKAFYKAKGFLGIDNVKSGDDDLLLHKMKPYLKKLKFIYSSDAAVTSFEDKDLSKQYETEKRRASKWKFYPLWIKLLTLFIFTYYMAFTVFMFLWFKEINNFMSLIFFKVIPEFLLVGVFLLKTKKIKYLIAFPIVELFYIPYFIYFGLKGLKGNYKWKE